MHGLIGFITHTVEEFAEGCDVFGHSSLILGSILLVLIKLLREDRLVLLVRYFFPKLGFSLLNAFCEVGLQYEFRKHASCHIFIFVEPFYVFLEGKVEA